MTLELCYIRLERIPLQPTTPLPFRLLGCHSFHPRNIFHVFTCAGLEMTQAMGECLPLISSLRGPTSIPSPEFLRPTLLYGADTQSESYSQEAAQGSRAAVGKTGGHSF